MLFNSDLVSSFLLLLLLWFQIIEIQVIINYLYRYVMNEFCALVIVRIRIHILLNLN